MNTVILLVGPPGSGKGTLSQICAQELGWEKVSTGDLCRVHIEKQTEIGKTIDFAIKSGKLIPDSLMSQMVFDWFNQRENGSDVVILDGYPRTVNQAKYFDELTSRLADSVRVVVAKFVIDDNSIIERLSNRHICKNKECQRVYSVKESSALTPKRGMVCDSCGSTLIKRKDDNPDAIRERLKVYHLHERDLLLHYEDVGYEVREFKSDVSINSLFKVFKQKIEG